MNIQMRAIPLMYASFMNAPAAPSAQAQLAAPINPLATGMDLLNISPEAQSRYNTHLEALGGVCNTCATRAYVCSDGGVSRPSPQNAAAYVVAHERAHLNEDRAAAIADGNRVVSQNMSIFYATCHECGVIYVAGGEARSTIASETRAMDDYSPGAINRGCAPDGTCCGCGCCGSGT